VRQARLLDVLPELGERLAGVEQAEARASLLVAVAETGRGQWAPDGHRHPGHLGLLIIEGAVFRKLTVAGSRSLELLSRADLLRPWQEDESSFAHSQWEVLTPVRYAILDRQFTRAAGRWPAVIEAILAQSMRRSRSLAVNAAIEAIHSLDERVMVLMWHLAERWGSVEEDGVAMPLRLTHEMLAGLVGAARPSVTTALGRLRSAGLLERRTDGSWLLRGSPPGVEGFDETEPSAMRDLAGDAAR
jgi:CRP/FNR family cyclic AMP-dependent transcriptional regulator